MNDTIILDKDYLALRGFTAYRLAKVSGVKENSVYAIINGKTGPTLKTARAILAALELPLTNTFFKIEYAKSLDAIASVELTSGGVSQEAVAVARNLVE